MLTNERIKEAQTNINSYIQQELLKKETPKEIIHNTYIKNHRESLILAKKIYEEEMSNLWTIVISYYSMFYIANALIYKTGYKVGRKIAHKITSDALIALIRNKLKEQLIEEYEIASNEALALTDTLLQNYDYERIKRSNFQYETSEEIKRAKAKTSIERAEQFSKEIEKLMIA